MAAQQGLVVGRLALETEKAVIINAHAQVFPDITSLDIHLVSFCPVL
jgi:hypothetical protein